MKKILLTLIMMLGIFMLVGCGKETVNLNDYVTIETSGYDSIGEAKYTFDYQKFNQDFGKDIKYNFKYKKEAQKLFGTEKPLSKVLLNECVDQSLSKTSELSNGDKIVLEWNCDEELAEKYFNCDLVFSDITYQVNNLEEITRKDIFKYYEVEIFGQSPNATAIFYQWKHFKGLEDVTPEITPSNNISEGDPLYAELKLNCTPKEFADKYGYLPEAYKKTYTAEGLEHYATSISEIMSGLQEELDKESRQIFQDEINEHWVKPETLQSVELVNKYLLYTNSDIKLPYMNALIFVYKINATHPKTGKMVEYYYYVEYRNIVINYHGGAFVESNTVLVPKGGWAKFNYKVDGYVYYGYETIEDFEEDRIQSRLTGNYDYIKE